MEGPYLDQAAHPAASASPNPRTPTPYLNPNTNTNTNTNTITITNTSPNPSQSLDPGPGPGPGPDPDPEPRWLTRHLRLQISGLALGLAGLALALMQFGPLGGSLGGHGLSGLVVSVLGVLQPLNGFLRPKKGEKGE